MQSSKPEREATSWWRSRAYSFGHAIAGVRYLIASQVHAQVHAVATVAVVFAAAFFSVTALEWALLALAIGLVWLAEAINTAIEALVDLVHPQWARPAGLVKDIAAGAVLLAAISAAAVGTAILGPYAIGLLDYPG